MDSYQTDRLRLNDFFKLFLHKKVLGKRFVQLLSNIKFYKLINRSMVHYDFTYKIGLNVYNGKFNPLGDCDEGGLYFSSYNDICKFFDGQYYICDVALPDDATIYIESDKFKCDKIILSNPTEISRFNGWTDNYFCIDAAMYNIGNFRAIKNIRHIRCYDFNVFIFVFFSIIVHCEKYEKNFFVTVPDAIKLLTFENIILDTVIPSLKQNQESTKEIVTKLYSYFSNMTDKKYWEILENFGYTPFCRFDTYETVYNYSKHIANMLKSL